MRAPAPGMIHGHGAGQALVECGLDVGWGPGCAERAARPRRGRRPASSSRRTSAAAIGTGLAAAVGVHAAWNGTFLLADAAIVVVYLLVFLPTFVVLLTLARRAQRHEAELVRRRLEPELRLPPAR